MQALQLLRETSGGPAMILTEEQRAALKRVVAYMDEMYAIASPYYGCTEDADLLRAMIDSSEHFTDATKLIGFDLERARAEVDTASSRRFSESREQARIFCAEEILPDALDEIERLREALDESEQILAHKTKTSTHWYDEHLQARADRVQTRRVVEQQAARIQELEDALVEERGNKMIQTDDCTQNQEAADIHHRCICEYNVKKCPVGQWWLDRARVALHAEGKIGPDADAKPRVWQITDERVEALKVATGEMDLSENIFYLNSLKTMLTEAGQE
jgi:hypothetical protein